MVAARDMMGGLAKGLAVIETFTAERPRQSIAEVSATSGLDRATARRCLLTLAELGYADYDGKFFTLTPRVLRLGTACLATMPLPRLVQPTLDRLSETLNESASVSILDGAEIVYVARAARQRVMSIGLGPGSRLPAYCTSMGRVLLAALTLTDPDQIMARLAQVRARGFEVIDQEVEIGLRSIAVPLMNARGQVVAALNVGVAAVQKSVEDLQAQFLPALQQAQAMLRPMLT